MKLLCPASKQILLLHKVAVAMAIKIQAAKISCQDKLKVIQNSDPTNIFTGNEVSQGVKWL